MKLYQYVSALFLLAVPLLSQAFTPESGFYYMYTSDNTQSGGGTGLAVEIQNETLFAAGYIYTTSGAPAWVTIGGKLTLVNGAWTVSDVVAGFANGQCVDTPAKCPYKEPSPAQAVGNFKIQFVAENLGTMTWGAVGNEQTVNLIRVGYSGADAPSSLVGEWDVLIDHQGTAVNDAIQFEGDRLLINSYGVVSGVPNFGGCIPVSEANPSCGAAGSKNIISGTAPACSGFCLRQYTLSVFLAQSKLVRVYHINENGLGGQFTGTIKGTVDLCPAGAATAAQCTTAKGLPFVAYRSGSANYAKTGAGMD